MVAGQDLNLRPSGYERAGSSPPVPPVPSESGRRSGRHSADILRSCGNVAIVTECDDRLELDRAERLVAIRPRCRDSTEHTHVRCDVGAVDVLDPTAGLAH